MRRFDRRWSIIRLQIEFVYLTVILDALSPGETTTKLSSHDCALSQGDFSSRVSVMEHHKISVKWGRATCALVFVLGAQLSQPKPLTKAEVLSLVAAWPSATSTLHLIQQRGISFSPTEEYVRMLGRASGGRSGAALEETLRGAKARPSSEAEVSTEAALLQHLIRCGELNNSQSPIPHSSEAAWRFPSTSPWLLEIASGIFSRRGAHGR
jgi:hypothetical protein